MAVGEGLDFLATELCLSNQFPTMFQEQYRTKVLSA